LGVSVIIPTYNNERTIGLVIEALKNQKISKDMMEVIIIDDGSKDSTIEICESHGINVIKNNKNKGLSYTLNRGITLSKHEIVVTLHGDTIPLSENWLSELIDPLDDFSIAASCSLQEPPTHSSDVLSIWEKLLWSKLDEHNALNNKADAYRKGVLIEINLFDSHTFRTAGEDEDLALRLRLTNKKIAATKAKVLHAHMFKCDTDFKCLIKILKKEYIFGQAGGALRRKKPFYKPGSYVFPSPKSFIMDGLFRTFICIGSLLPYIQIVCIPILIIASLFGITKSMNYIKNKKVIFLYPSFNIIRFWVFSIGYIIGIFKGKQT